MAGEDAAADGVRGERDRLARAYAEREKAARDSIGWSWLVPEAHWLDFRIQRFLAQSIVECGWPAARAADCRLLEVGCGGGQVLRWLYDCGLRRLYGCDVIDWRAQQARVTSPFAEVTVADMAQLPYADGSFDVVVQVTTFSSCLDAALKKSGVREFCRVLKRGGVVLWCDILPDAKPAGPARGIDAHELQALFPGAAFSFSTFGAKPSWIGRLASVGSQGPGVILRKLGR